MVKICSVTSYPKDNENKYKEYFEKYPFELSIFQKWAIESIVEGHNVLVTAHTGTGKTLPAEFAIEYFSKKGKKVIYTAPIKSLVNQKFNDFTNKYEDISVGILTGDIKFNPQANVLIMTAEILLNKLYQNKNVLNNNNSASPMDFEIDIHNDVGCVVIDEVHFFNDPSRGMVWENTFMLLPSHIQLVMLSATIDKPEKFAEWCENIHPNSNKEVYLTNTTHRVVPLTHYSFITATQSVFKTIKDKALQQEIKSIIDKPFIIQTSNGKFNDEHYSKMTKILNLFDKNDIRIKRAHVLNQVTKYLTENEMLPALCFVLNRKQLEVCANEITTNLQEFDTKVPYIIDYECEQILRKKLPNFEEYMHLPEYNNMIKLLRKGIAIHHSGILPILKEIVEIFYAKGYIKLLFATETFCIGVNMPTKTVIFTDVNKFDGSVNRMLYSHEMGQMSGRAGRRGLDNIGYCIHLNNLFRNVDSVNYKTMMNGKPQTLISKFKISYNLLLNLIDIGNTNIIDFAKKSMTTDVLQGQMEEINSQIIIQTKELEQIKGYLPNLRTPTNIIEEYDNLQKTVKFTVNKKRKETERRIQNIKDEYKFVEQDLNSYTKITNLENEIQNKQKQVDNLTEYFKTGVETVLNVLEKDGYISKNENICLTNLGKIASQIREVHCLVFSKLYEDKVLDNLEPKQLIALFSCFTNVKVQDEIKDNNPKSSDSIVNKLIGTVEDLYNENKDKELTNNINTGAEYDIHYDLLTYVERWVDCENVNDCKLILQDLEEQKEIFLGEFVKAILKINNISCEFEKIAELTNNVAFLHKLKQIPYLTLKFVVTNQSLYV